MNPISLGRRTFVKGAVCMAATGLAGAVPVTGKKSAVLPRCQGDVLDIWQNETELVSPDAYEAYMQDGDTRALEFAPFLDFALITHNHSDHWRLACRDVRRWRRTRRRRRTRIRDVL